MNASDDPDHWSLVPHWPTGAFAPAIVNSLAAWIVSVQATPPLARLNMAQAIAAKVVALHASGVICGDIAPATIAMVDGAPVLLQATFPADGSGIPWGTPHYLAPEVAAGAPPTPASDVYALAATLVHLLLQEQPFLLPTEPAAFWAAKQAGPVPDWPDAPSLPEEVRSVLLAGVISEARLRPAASAIASAIATAIAHADAIAIRHSAAGRLERAADGGQDDIAGIISDLETAATAYPTDLHCRGLLQSARLLMAKRAIDGGEVSKVRKLAATLDPNKGPAARLMYSAAGQQRRRLRWRAALRFGAIVGGMLVCAGIVIWTAMRQRPAHDWQTAWERRFDGIAIQPTSLVSKRYAENEGRLLQPATDGSVHLPESELVWLAGIRESGDIRVCADIVWPQRVDGLELLVHAEEATPPQWWMMPRGLGCQFGGRQGMVHVLSPNTVAGPPADTITAPCDLVPGRTYRLVLELQGDRARMLVDDRVVLEHLIDLPLCGDGLDRVGIRSWSPVVCRALSVEREQLQDRIEPIAIGDALLAAGSPDRALAVWQRMAADRPGSAIAETASARGYMTACLNPDLPPGRAWFLDRLILHHSHGRWTSQCQAAEARMLWRTGNRRPALELATSIIDRDPTSRVALDILATTPRPLPVADAQALLSLVCRRQELPQLNLSRLGLEHIEDLRGRQVRILELTDNRIHNLAPLAGMPLVDLEASGNPISEISVLAGLRSLRRLRISHTAITDLHPLQGLPLNSVELEGNAISDLAPLRGMPLRKLAISGTAVVDLSPLRYCPLEELLASNCGIVDLTPLTGAHLTLLSMPGNRISNLAPLRSMPLRTIDLSRNNIADVTPLAGLPLRSVTLADNSITDLSALPASILELDLCGNQISDLSPLAPANDDLRRPSRPMDSLLLDGNPLLDIAALARIESKQLSVADCGLRTLPSGRHASIEASRNRFVGLATIDLQPCRLYLAGSGIAPAPLLALAERWQAQQADLELVNGVRIQAAAAAGDVEALRAMAVPAGGQRLVAIATRLTLAQAQEEAQRLRARLPSIPDTATERALVAVTTPITACWLGLRSGPEGWAWQDGSRSLARPLPNASAHTGAWHFYVVQGMVGWAPTPAQQLGSSRSGLVLAW